MTRIIAGSAKGRRLRTPSGERTRPTSDRVREALFGALESALGPLTGLRVLDLYAGSGALGLEALSRGAAVATLVEADRRTAQLVRANAETLGFLRAEVVAARVESTVAQPPRAPYDVVFLDPPYSLAQDALTQVLALLVVGGWLVPGALLVVERSKRSAEPAWPRGLAIEQSRAYGETVLWWAVATRHDDGPTSTMGRRTSALPGGETGGDRVRRAVCPGSFDPVTNGHIDIISRASALFDEVVVAVGVNKAKSSARLFSAEERLEMLETVCADYPNVSVAGFEGLLTTFCTERGIGTIVKGLRAISDFDYELQMAQMNSSLVDVETVFIPTSPEYSFLASSLVKEVATFGGDVSTLVPHDVLARLAARVAERAEEGRP